MHSGFVRALRDGLDRLTAPIYRPIRRDPARFRRARFLALGRPSSPSRSCACCSQGWRWSQRDLDVTRAADRRARRRRRASRARRPQVAAFRAATGRAPGLAIVLVGEDPASAVYVRSKGKATLEAGMESFSHKLPADTSQADLLALVDRLNADPAVDGILVQLPLPPHIDANTIIPGDRPRQGRRRLPPGQCRPARHRAARLRPVHAARLPDAAQGRARRPRRASRGGRRPLEHRRQADGACCCSSESCTVTIVHSRTRDLPSLTRQADILVAAIGRARR